MKTTQVLFLLKMSLINSQLIENWDEKHKPLRAYSEIRSAISWQRLAFFSFMIAGIVIFSGFFLGQLPIKLAGAAILTCIGAYVFANHGESKFTADITALNNLLRQFPTDNEVEIYCLDMDMTWMTDKAKWLLVFFASELRNHETSLGVDHPTTREMRNRFKNAHATLVNFGLCNPNQGVYLRCVEEPEMRKTEAVTASPAQ